MNVEKTEHHSSVSSVQPVRPVVPKRGKWSWVVVLILLGAAGYGIYRWIAARHSAAATAASAPAPRRIPVVVATAHRGDLPIYLEGLGTVTALNTVTIRSRVDGELVKVAFVEGQSVKAGDLIAEIDPRPFQTQLAQAEAQLAKEQAQLTFAKQDLLRYEEVPKAAVSQQQRDTAVAAEHQAQAALQVDQAQIDAIKLQLTYCRITSPITGRIGLRLVDQGNMVHANDLNGLAVITQIEPISVVFSLSEDVLPQVLKAHAAGKNLVVEAQNRDRTSILATGLFEAVDSQIDSGTLMVKIKANFDNKDRALFPNQAVNARLLVDTKRDAVLIPQAAIQHSPQSATFVYVVNVDNTTTAESNNKQAEHAHAKSENGSQHESVGNPDPATTTEHEHRLQGTVEMRTVTAGAAEGDLISIDHGLSAGDIVVIDGVDKLQPSSKVVAHEAEASVSQQATTATRPHEPSKGKRR